MLVLTRKPGQEIRIGDNVVLSVIRVQGGRVQIGIAAPGAVSIRRAELRGPFAGSEPLEEAPERLKPAS